MVLGDVDHSIQPRDDCQAWAEMHRRNHDKGDTVGGAYEHHHTKSLRKHAGPVEDYE